MTTAEEVKKLAALARIEVPEADIERFTKEFDAILAYVGQLDSLDIGGEAKAAVGSSPGAAGAALREAPALRNVMREDGEPHAAGAYTETLAAQFPAREGDALVVKQVITHE